MKPAAKAPSGFHKSGTQMKTKFFTNLTILALPLLAGVSCSTTASEAEYGPSPYARVRAEKEKPLSSDPDSALHNVQAADGGVGVKVMEF